MLDNDRSSLHRTSPVMAGTAVALAASRRQRCAEIERLVRRLEELQEEDRKDTEPLVPEAVAAIWAASLAALQSAARFLVAVLPESGATDGAIAGRGFTPADSTSTSMSTVLRLADQLHGSTEELQEARLRSHTSLMIPDRGEAVWGADVARAAGAAVGHALTAMIASDAATAEACNVRALCPRCHKHFEWAPLYYKDAAGGIVAERMKELQRRCQAHADELRQQIALERDSLRRFVEDSLDALLNFNATPLEVSNLKEGMAALAASTSSSPQHGAAFSHPRRMLESLRLRSAELRTKQTRQLSRERLEDLRRQKVAEVMSAAEAHLEQVWEQSMASKLEEAFAAPLLAPPSVISRLDPLRITALQHDSHARARVGTDLSPVRLDTGDSEDETSQAVRSGADLIMDYEMIGAHRHRGRPAGADGARATEPARPDWMKLLADGQARPATEPPPGGLTDKAPAISEMVEILRATSCNIAPVIPEMV